MSAVAGFLTLAFGIYLGWVMGLPPPPALEARHPGFDWEQARIVIWLGTLPAAFVMQKAVEYSGAAPGLWIARRFVGLVCRGVLAVVLMFTLGTVMTDIEKPLGVFDSWPGYLVFMGVILGGVFFLLPRVKEYAGRFGKPVIDLGRMTKFGKGGSAAFGGLLEEWRMHYKPGAILLGSSFYDPRWRVGSADDRGLLTIAASRGGKGRSAIIPNLILWPGSALVIDPKGTNAAVTAARRGHGGGRVTDFLGQEVHIVDPFRIVPGAQSACFNPLAGIDLSSNQATEDIGLVADALVVPGGDQDSHWDESARTIIAGLIAHLLATGKGKTLVDLRNALRKDEEGLDALFAEMAQDMSAGGLPASAATVMLNAGQNERGSFMTTIMRNIRWLDSVAIQGILGRSDFAIDALKDRPMTVYVVLPPHLLDEHKRFMRLFVNMAIRGLSQGARGKVPVLFLLDEFYSLGKITLLEKAAGLMAGYGMRLWPIVQNLSQLQQLYPKNWETFIANAGVVQVFSTADQTTTQYLANRLGKRANKEKIGEQMTRVVSQLREPEEFELDVGRQRQRQIIFRSGDYPLLLRRLRYDKTFDISQYNPDPDYEKHIGTVLPVAPAPPLLAPAGAAPAPLPEPVSAAPAPETEEAGLAEAAVPDPVELFAMLCDEKNLTLTDEAEDKLVDVIVNLTEKPGGNGSTEQQIRDLFARCLQRQELRLAQEPAADTAARHTLVESDIPEA